MRELKALSEEERLSAIEARLEALVKWARSVEEALARAQDVEERYLEDEVEWAWQKNQFCAVCGGAGHTYVPASTVYPQPAEYPPCPACNGWGVVDVGGKPFRRGPVPRCPVTEPF